MGTNRAGHDGLLVVLSMHISINDDMMRTIFGEFGGNRR